MDTLRGDIHQTARDWFLAKVVNGEVPLTCGSGSLDGLHYYRIDIDGMEYWLTDAGLFDALPMDTSDGA